MGAEVGLDASLGPGSLLPERLHGKSTRVIQVDFTGGLEIYEAIEAGLKDLEIGTYFNHMDLETFLEVLLQ